METLIELKNVSKKFGDNVAVQHVSFTVRRGEIFGLLGHNGAGKSTIIGMMLGQVWADSGEIRLFNYNIYSQRENALKKVGAIFEIPAFYDYLSGWKNLEILSCYSAPTPPDRIKQVIDWVGLTGREHSKVKTYSHGMRTRLALAQALLPGPELLILDEPGEGLDPEGIAEMRHTIFRLHRELGLTIFLSSHLLNEVEQLCSRIVVIKNGSLIYDGELSEIKSRNRWYRLKVSNFQEAVGLLKGKGLISSFKDSEILPPENVNPPAIVQCLVENKIEVYEFYKIEESLESFYLYLMKKDTLTSGSGKLDSSGDSYQNTL
ncbi:MAG: ABC transporter ATP-binding protein [Verrucomicrobiia bacterium]